MVFLPCLLLLYRFNLNAQRTFLLTDTAKTVLLEHIDRTGFSSVYVFPKENGEFTKQANYYKRWVKYRKQAEITQATLYELRHTFISIVKKLPVWLIKPIVGHSVNMDTYKVYGHEVDGEMQHTSELINKVFHDLLIK